MVQIRQIVDRTLGGSWFGPSVCRPSGSFRRSNLYRLKAFGFHGRGRRSIIYILATSFRILSHSHRNRGTRRACESWLRRLGLVAVSRLLCGRNWTRAFRAIVLSHARSNGRTRSRRLRIKRFRLLFGRQLTSRGLGFAKLSHARSNGRTRWSPLGTLVGWWISVGNRRLGIFRYSRRSRHHGLSGQRRTHC